jgi:hypothetical protein
LELRRVQVAELEAAGDRVPSIEQDIRVQALNESLIVRYDVYTQHLNEILMDLFGPLDRELRDVIGFTIEEATRLAIACAELTSVTIHERMESVRPEIDELERQVKRARRRGRPPDGMISALAGMTPRKPRRRSGE